MIEIPGYRIIRALGRGGMATVYLAMQESVQREVALKVMSPTLHGDAEFGERFLREARIAASLRHRHVVQVHDVGRTEDVHYIAMEYLSGGPVLQRDLGASNLAFCLRIAREIALALDYAHKRGVIHRDIKPDNILLRDDDAAVLSDFGIARAQDTKRMTMTGTILGTPHYMSPEQASGGDVDGRSDLYSLGVVFHEMAVGVVPFDAADWVSVGLMHLSAPVPRLPPALQKLQPLIDTMLAKDPAERVQTGAELAEVLAEFETSLSGPRPSLVKPPPPAAPTTVLPITNKREPGFDADADEPVLGEIAQALSRPSPRARRRTVSESGAGRGSGNALRYAILLVVAVLGLAYMQRDALRELLSPSRNEELLQQAEDALRRGYLTGRNPDGAQELFQAVKAFDPDNARARDGLVRVAEGLLDRVRSALADDRIDVARTELDRARAAQAPAAAIEELDSQIRSREQRDGELSELVGRAQKALSEGRLDGADDSALALYAKALAVAPDSAVALVGRRDTLGLMLERAGRLVEQGEFDAAEAQIELVAGIDPAHLALPDARGRLAVARQVVESGVGKLVEEGDALRRQGRLVSPAGNSARDRYRSVLQREPDHAAARTGLAAIAASLIQQANRQMADFEFDRADDLLQLAADTDPNAAGLRAAQARARDLRQRRGDLAAGILSPAQQAQLDRVLAAAATARAANNLMFPPGESAYDLYRQALAIEPSNATAKQGMAELPAAVRQLFEQALGSSRVNAALGYLEGLQSLAPNDTALPDMRRRLAAALLGYASERLGAGELQIARKAVDQAAGLDPNHPDLIALRARLEQAR